MNISARSSQLRSARVAGDPVRRRKLFYIPGFDPLGPRRYRELARREGPTQGAISGFQFEMLPPAASERGRNHWRMRWGDGAVETVTDVTVLDWSDLVRKALPASLPGLYLALFRTFWVYLSSGALGKMMGLRRGPLIAGLGAGLIMVFYLLYSALVGAAAGVLLGAFAYWPLWGVAIAAFATAVAALYATCLFEGQMMTHYIICDLAYVASKRGEWPQSLERRIDAFADEIRRAASDPTYDEVLVVGHSSGTQLSVSALARAKQTMIASGGLNWPTLSLLTLGQTIPMISFLPGASRLRAELRQLARDLQIRWVDVSSMADVACFPLCNAAAPDRTVLPDGPDVNPLILSADFNGALEPEVMTKIRHRFLRVHFQYLFHFARPKNYDPFSVMAGPKTLAQRYQGRKPSPQAIGGAVGRVGA